MPIPESHSTNEASLLLPRCSRCAEPMRLVAVEPHSRLSTMDTRHFVCSCGGTVSETVPRHWFGVLSTDDADAD
jgi:hypothetical protein